MATHDVRLISSDIEEAAMNVLTEHAIECTGPGEVSCRGCRELGWMSWGKYRRHVAALIARSVTVVEDI